MTNEDDIEQYGDKPDAWRRKSDGLFAVAPTARMACLAFDEYDAKPDCLKPIEWGMKAVDGDQVTGFDYEKGLVQLATVTRVMHGWLKDVSIENRRWVRPEDVKWA